MKYVYLTFGFAALGLAALGVFLPLLPTTPFLLLAAFCFARSSQRWYDYLMNHRIFGRYLRNYQAREMTSGNKAFTLTVMWAGMSVCAWFMRKRLHVVIILAVIAVCVTAHLLMLSRPGRGRKRAGKGRRRTPPSLREESEFR